MHKERRKDCDGEDVNNVDEAFPGQDPQVIQVAHVWLDVIRLLELEAEFEAEVPESETLLENLTG